MGVADELQKLSESTPAFFLPVDLRLFAGSGEVLFKNFFVLQVGWVCEVFGFGLAFFYAGAAFYADAGYFGAVGGVNGSHWAEHGAQAAVVAFLGVGLGFYFADVYALVF